MTDVTTEETAGRTFETIGIVGLGTMGAGIAEVFAREGYTVIGVDQNEEARPAAASSSSTRPTAR